MFFSVNNGVRQGGILSPLFFNPYMNDMSITLGELPIGCCSGNTVINHLIIYADDIVLFAPSLKGVQSLLDVCSSYAMHHDIIFNCDKSKLK